MTLRGGADVSAGPWRPAAGSTYEERREEQDAAAGGRGARAVSLPGGRTATASVELKQPNTVYKVYGYLKFTAGQRTIVKYIGRVPHHSRPAALKAAWKMARKKGLLDQRG